MSATSPHEAASLKALFGGASDGQTTGERLRHLISHFGWKKSQLGDVAKLNRVTLERIEKGETTPSAITLREIRRAVRELLIGAGFSATGASLVNGWFEKGTLPTAYRKIQKDLPGYTEDRPSIPFAYRSGARVLLLCRNGFTSENRRHTHRFTLRDGFDYSATQEEQITGTTSISGGSLVNASAATWDWVQNQLPPEMHSFEQVDPAEVTPEELAASQPFEL